VNISIIAPVTLAVNLSCQSYCFPFNQLFLNMLLIQYCFPLQEVVLGETFTHPPPSQKMITDFWIAHKKRAPKSKPKNQTQKSETPPHTPSKKARKRAGPKKCVDFCILSYRLKHFPSLSLLLVHFLILSQLNTGRPRYMRSFYLRFRVYAIQKWPFFWNLSSNIQ